MNPDMPTNWTPGLVVLGAALLIGVILALRARGGARPRAVAADGTDLERQRDALYQQIRELDAQKTNMVEADFRRERRRLELDAARTLKALAEGPALAAPGAAGAAAAGAAAAPARPAPVTWADRHPRLVGALWTASAFGLLAGLWWSVERQATPKEEMGGMAGGGMGGGAAPASGGGRAEMEARMDAQLQAALAQAEAAAKAKPDDAEAQCDWARLLIQTGKIKDAFDVLRKVTEKQPDHPTARALGAAILIQLGDLEKAGGVLDRVLEKNPTHTEAMGWRGVVYMQLGDREKAAEIWEKAAEVDPSEADTFRRMAAIARAPASEAGPMAGASSAGASSAGASSAAPPPAAPSEQDVVGTITLAPGVNPPASGIVFVYARPDGVTAGQPAAALKLPVAAFPMSFRIGPGNSPMGGPFPNPMTLTARLDADGNAMTKDPADPAARLDGVKAGQQGVTLTLAAP